MFTDGWRVTLRNVNGDRVDSAWCFTLLQAREVVKNLSDIMTENDTITLIQESLDI